MSLSQEEIGGIAVLVLETQIKGGRMGGNFFITDDLSVIKSTLVRLAVQSGVSPMVASEFGGTLVSDVLIKRSKELEVGR